MISGQSCSAPDRGECIMNKLFIIKTGTTFTSTARQCGDFESLTRNGLKIDHSEICVVDAENGAILPHVEERGGVIATGSENYHRTIVGVS
jgi:GMP synthase (glutamine-hydrolysing)